MRQALLAVVVIGLAHTACPGQSTRGSWRTNEGAKTARTLKEAVQDCVRELRKDGKAQYVPLMTEELVRAAIRDAVQHYEFGIGHDPNQPADAKAMFLRDIKPMAMGIVDGDAFPANCTFWGFYSMGTHSGSTEGFYLRLDVESPTSEIISFSLPVLDLSWGRVDVSPAKIAGVEGTPSR